MPIEMVIGALLKGTVFLTNNGDFAGGIFIVYHRVRISVRMDFFRFYDKLFCC